MSASKKTRQPSLPQKRKHTSTAAELDNNIGTQSIRQACYRNVGVNAQFSLSSVVPSYENVTASNGAVNTFSSTSTSNRLPPTNLYSYMHSADCNQICEYCGAYFWYNERLLSSSSTRTPKYNRCCKAGSVRLLLPKDPPENVKRLFEQPYFLGNIRAYNSMFAMTSFGAKINDSINTGTYPYVFKVGGQICHWIGTLCPPMNEKPRFLQMYIYDTDNELCNRLRFFDHDTNSRLNPTIVQDLIYTLDNCNEFVKLFRGAREVCLADSTSNFTVHLHSFQNRQRYDTPSSGCIGAIVYEGDSTAKDFDIVIHLRDGTPHRISKLHPSYMALQYPLLMLYGELGWSPDLRTTASSGTRNRQLTMNMFYSYQLHDRHNLYTLLLRGGRLFQQYLVDSYICIEQNRLHYIDSHQNLFRSEFLQGIHDAILRGDTEGNTIGKRTFLPSSFTGGLRYMYKHYQDALAICRVYGNPQYFITFTCNVKWPEINNYMSAFPSLKAQDRPDIVARVFQMKVNAMVDFLKNQKPFGRVAADLYTIEFQKRGLPHCHMLLWVTTAYKIHNPCQLDSYISVEIPDPVKDSQLYKVITEFMIHGPCGLPKGNFPCMSTGSCSKKYPKAYEEQTYFDKKGFVRYKRQASGHQVTKNGVTVDNAYVIPYNKILCLRFNAHINVEYCGWSMLIKYLFKYISKGSDRVRYTITKTTPSSDASPVNCKTEIDEIKNFVDARFICPHEAAWRIFNFPIHNRNPAVQLLAVHLKNMQNIRFKDTQQLHNVVTNPFMSRTTLTEWLRNNQSDIAGRDLRYIDYVSEYRWDSTGKFWIRRSTNKTPVVGRLIYVHPTCGETFYLRMLLAHQTGCQSFRDIRTIANETYPTYRAACEKLGLLGDDKEWIYAFDEASHSATASELRSLFTHMLLYCDRSNPMDFWEKQWRKMGDDITHHMDLLMKKMQRNTYYTK